jgi:hypothetical protein
MVPVGVTLITHFSGGHRQSMTDVAHPLRTPTAQGKVPEEVLLSDRSQAMDVLSMPSKFE